MFAKETVFDYNFFEIRVKEYKFIFPLFVNLKLIIRGEVRINKYFFSAKQAREFYEEQSIYK